MRPRGQIAIRGCRIVEEQTVLRPQVNWRVAFELHCGNSGKIFTLVCADQASKESWIEAIQAASMTKPILPRLECSEPLNAKRVVHITEHAKEGLLGVPKAWQKYLVEQGPESRQDRPPEAPHLGRQMPESEETLRISEILSEEDISLQYSIERKIGQGAFGEVHIGRDILTERRVRIYY